MICHICNKEHDGSYGSGRFCSKSCANKRVHTKETKEKISKALQGRPVTGNSTPEAAKRANEIWVKKSNDAIMNEDFSKLSFERLRKRVIIEQEGKCSKCGISDWLGKKISFELDHIDGNHYNNARENIEALCPNCHSQTDTWRGRNKSSQKKITDDDVVDAFILTGNIRKTLLHLNLAAKGANYGRVKRALTLRSISY